MTSLPFSPGTISVGLYTTSTDAALTLDDIFSQADAAQKSGFDGVTISEHHAGFASYVPNPMQMAGWILDRVPDIWAGPCPLLLPLRSSAIVAEEAAWLNVLHPGRVVVGVAPGYAPGDFEVIGFEHADRVPLFESNLERLARIFRGQDDLLGADPAISALVDRPVPLVAAAGSPAAARRAARLGSGLISDSLATTELLQERFEIYRGAGGSGPLVVNRRAWVGANPDEQLAQQYSTWQREGGATAPSTFGAEIVFGEPASVAAELVQIARSTGADHISLKIFIEGLSNSQVVDQLEKFAPVVRAYHDAFGVVDR